ncbi:MAG: hypothetical protein LBU69_02385 [Deltaproteobacteria bacterium]|jgi:hypothetical protein|nr:hypothetical protein [Deltaproteobacteria bacterium]
MNETAGHCLNDATIIRPLRPDEAALLDEFLYHTVYKTEPDEEPIPRYVTGEPGIREYIEGFGKNGDVCFVAELGGQVIGAVWLRLFAWTIDQLFGVRDENTPELVI